MPPRKQKKIIDDNTVNAVATFIEKAVAKQDENSSEDEIEVYVEKRSKIARPRQTEVAIEQPQSVVRATKKPNTSSSKAREKPIDDFQLLYKSQKEELDLLRSIHIASLTTGKSLREPTYGQQSLNVCNVPTVQSAREPLPVHNSNDVDTRRQMFQLRFG